LGGADDLVQVSVHQLVYYVHVLKRVLVGRSHYVFDSYDVFVRHVPQQLYLSQHSPGVDDVVERVPDLLDCNFLVIVGVSSGTA
jgi:hypothetical protein